MSKKVKWYRSEEGYCDSKCGRFEIIPLPCGTTRPQYYDLYYNDPFDLSRTKIVHLSDTQRDLKLEAEDYLARKKS